MTMPDRFIVNIAPSRPPCRSCLWLAGCLALLTQTASALIEGQVDDANRYGAVVALWSDEARSCSATKIAPATFLTAAHCVVDFASGDLARRFQPGGTLRIGAGIESRLDDTQTVAVIDTELPPAFRAGLERLRAYQQSLIDDYRARYRDEALARRIRHLRADSRITDRFPDAALIRVATPTPNIPEMPVSLAPLQAGARVTLVGYGCERVRDWQGPDRQNRPARRLWGDTHVIRVDDVNFYTFGSEGRPGSATLCPGDSGGPVLFEGQVVGVHGTVWGLSYRDTARSNMSVNLHRLTNWEAWTRLGGIHLSD